MNKIFIFLFLVLIGWNEEGRRGQDFLLIPQWFESFRSHLPRARWRNIVFVECLYMVKQTVVGVCYIGGL